MALLNLLFGTPYFANTRRPVDESVVKMSSHASISCTSRSSRIWAAHATPRSPRSHK